MGFFTRLFGDPVNSLLDKGLKIFDEVHYSAEEKQEQQTEMLKTQNQHTQKMRELDVKEQEIYLKDTASAREAQSAVQSSEDAVYLAKIIVPLLGIIVVVSTFVLFYVLLFSELTMSTNRKEIALYILGILSTITAQVFNFYYGTSKSSSEKNKLLVDRITPKS